ncbi:heme exporter protein CcmB [Salinimonas iocasae]|uniref:Heme exporter protein B n=1 Tax=Salinimonas iocasae TaxID=2572577 RepID=A0A5B7YFR4_9ALTE|nr:heme exporter protein CcmB [Salinimonas iocasae]QCZ94358.1 heme exporter protein CcmB [Salinimonas iocasae]
MSALYTGVFKRDLALAFRQKGELLQPVIFLLIVVCLFPIGVGPGPEILQRISPGVIWIAAILSGLLGMERLFKDDYHDGTLEQLILSGLPLSGIALSKVLTHWLVSFLPIICLSPVLAMFLNMSLPMYKALIITLLLGTPLLSLIGAIATALTVGLQRGSLLVSLLLLPVFIPLLIFATSAVESAAMQLSYAPQVAIISAMTCLALASAPFAISYALKVSQH